jgi:hypothetical protein
MVHSAPTGLNQVIRDILRAVLGRDASFKAMAEEKNKKKDFAFSAWMPRIPIGCPVKRKQIKIDLAIWAFGGRETFIDSIRESCNVVQPALQAPRGGSRSGWVILLE